MASKSYPRFGYNSGAVTELEHERLTNAVAPDGLLGDPNASPMVYADGSGTRQVRIRANRLGLVRGGLYDSGDTDITLASLDANSSGATRTDLVVLRLSRTDYSIVETAITGTPGAGAPSPVQQTGSTGFWDLPLADVRVENGATNLAANTVTPRAWFVGEDGGIQCTSNTRPPHYPGRTIRENTGRILESDGSRWLAHTQAGQILLSYTAEIFTRQVDFPIPYASAPAVFTNIASSAGESARIGTRAYNITSTGFRLFLFRTDPAEPASHVTNMPVQWIAQSIT